jgi:membrane-bound serine protease (ClpP class)
MSKALVNVVRDRLIITTVLAVLALIGVNRMTGDAARPVVYVVTIDGTIDLGLAPFLARTIREAQDANASAVLLDINTFGGRVDAAVAMRDTLLNAPVRTIAFVNPRAISAGALIALAAETIVMSSGGTLGAAAPVVSGGGPSQPASEKSVSYVRKEFGATAERRDALASSPKRWWTSTSRSRVSSRRASSSR